MAETEPKVYSLPFINAELFNDKVYHAELELNQFAAPRTGRIEAQTPLIANFTAEVGMVLVVDKWHENGACIRPAAGTDDATALYVLNYSTEHMYDERTPGLRYFYQKRADGNYNYRSNPYDDFYLRCGYMQKGDRFTTSAIEVVLTPATDTAEAAKTAFLTKLKAESNNYEGALFKAGTNGYWAEYDASTDTTYAGPIAKVVNPYIGMPDGSYGFMLEIVKE